MSAAKKVKLDGGFAASGRGEFPGGGAAAGPLPGRGSSPAENATANFGSLSVELLASIFGYLSWKDILRARVSRTCREAATRTLVPEFSVYSLRGYEALAHVSGALPNLQDLGFVGCTDEFVFEDGIDPDPAYRFWRTLPVRRVGVIANFPQLRSLRFGNVRLNGSYPRLLANFPHLQQLMLGDVGGLKLDLAMLSDLSSLRGLHCDSILFLQDSTMETIAESLPPVLEHLTLRRFPHLRGNMKSLRALKATLRTIIIEYCALVQGDIMEMADFPLLETLHLRQTPIRGDIRQIGSNDFPALKSLSFLNTGDGDRFFHRVADALKVMNALCRLKKRNGTIINQPGEWYGLAGNSPDRYRYDTDECRRAPFIIEFIEIGPCIGWRWSNLSGGVCKTNWVDEEPDRGSGDYADFWREVDSSLFKDFVDPPTEAEYQRLSEHW